MQDNLESIRRAASAEIRRAQDMIASGGLKRMAGLIRELDAVAPAIELQARQAVEAMGGAKAIQARFDAMTSNLRDLYHRAPQTYAITVEERKPAPKRQQTTAPVYGPGKEAMRCFILRQMVEAKGDESGAGRMRSLHPAEWTVGRPSVLR